MASAPVLACDGGLMLRTASGVPRAAFRGFGLCHGRLGAFGRRLLLLGRRGELLERRAEGVEAPGAGETVLGDQAPDGRRQCGELLVGEINDRHSSALNH